SPMPFARGLKAILFVTRARGPDIFPPVSQILRRFFVEPKCARVNGRWVDVFSAAKFVHMADELSSSAQELRKYLYLSRFVFILIAHSHSCRDLACSGL